MTWKGAKAVAEEMIGLLSRSLALDIQLSMTLATMNLQGNRGSLEQLRNLTHPKPSELKLQIRA